MGRQGTFLIVVLVLGLTSCQQNKPVAAGTAGATGNGMSAQSNAGGNAAASHKTLTDLPGITSQKDLASGVVPLKPADVQFYIKNMQATLDRYQHPTPQDLADIAEAKRLRQLQVLAQTKMAEDMKAGNMQKAMNEDMFHPTPEQQATLDRGNALTYNGLAQMLAKDTGMPGGQWDMLSQVVEYAAGVDATTGYGSGDDGPGSKPTTEQLAYAANRRRVAAANQALVAHDAPAIKRLHSLVMQAAADRAQANITQ